MGRGSETQPQVEENLNYLILASGLMINLSVLFLTPSLLKKNLKFVTVSVPLVGAVYGQT